MSRREISSRRGSSRILQSCSIFFQVLDLGENLLSGVLHPTLFDNLTSLLKWICLASKWFVGPKIVRIT
ncbi:uncharacterized protein [Zea mays]|uniref:Uncharacterized protein n=1 Tax=Zea mays TaxID=4577 RepID=B6SRF8_MAIZE|nr:uncharacterized protein LOC100193991 isoform 1 [Zea mays]XP_020406892.1 uncharacterized protein LOC100193991 isoform X1 [Zea mays]XP_035822573.1 uncharacterized protein LOC100193991 isoform X1 [Zea mays]ACG27441.1 hypothetical protein [Zea mays]ACG40882.1 hypothetical protein [Zea mays]|eukprot:NP_001315599.1 uncharacterized protein LOC100193991 isoform 1 [Zea mays]